MSSLFASFGASSPPASQSQPALFPSLGSTQPQQTPSLQLNLGEPSKPGQTTSGGGGGGLFSNFQPPGSQPQQTSSLFSPQKDATTSQPLRSSLFSSQQPLQPLQQQSQTGQPQKQDGQQSIGPGKVSQPAYFNNLLEKGKKRGLAADGGPGFNSLPSLQLGLGDIAKRARALGGVGLQTHGNAAADGKALAYGSGH